MRLDSFTPSVVTVYSNNPSRRLAAGATGKPSYLRLSISVKKRKKRMIDWGHLAVQLGMYYFWPAQLCICMCPFVADFHAEVQTALSSSSFFFIKDSDREGCLNLGSLSCMVRLWTKLPSSSSSTETKLSLSSALHHMSLSMVKTKGVARIYIYLADWLSLNFWSDLKEKTKGVSACIAQAQHVSDGDTSSQSHKKSAVHMERASNYILCGQSVWKLTMHISSYPRILSLMSISPCTLLSE